MLCGGKGVGVSWTALLAVSLQALHSDFIRVPYTLT